MKNPILDYLEGLDLTEIEAKLYMALLEVGPASVRDLAEAIGIKRTTAYLYVDQLIEKGLVIRIVKGAKKQVAAMEPKQSLQFLVEKNLETAQQLKKDFPDVIKTINDSLPQIKPISDAEVKYYKGINNIKNILTEAFKSKELRVYANLSELENLFKKNHVPLEYQTYDKALLKNKQLTIYEIVADQPGSVEQFNLNQTVETTRYHYKHMPQIFYYNKHM